MFFAVELNTQKYCWLYPCVSHYGVVLFLFPRATTITFLHAAACGPSVIPFQRHVLPAWQARWSPSSVLSLPNALQASDGTLSLSMVHLLTAILPKDH